MLSDTFIFIRLYKFLKKNRLIIHVVDDEFQNTEFFRDMKIFNWLHCSLNGFNCTKYSKYNEFQKCILTPSEIIFLYN